MSWIEKAKEISKPPEPAPTPKTDPFSPLATMILSKDKGAIKIAFDILAQYGIYMTEASIENEHMNYDYLGSGGYKQDSMLVSSKMVINMYASDPNTYAAIGDVFANTGKLGGPKW